MDEELLQELIGEDKKPFSEVVKEEVQVQMGPVQESL